MVGKSGEAALRCFARFFLGEEIERNESGVKRRLCGAHYSLQATEVKHMGRWPAEFAQAQHRARSRQATSC